MTKTYLDELTYEIIGCAIEVHKVMGRGLLETVYHQCLKEELVIKKYQLCIRNETSGNVQR